MVKLNCVVKLLASICLIVTLVGCAVTATTQNQNAMQHFDDSTITAKVKVAISNDSVLKKFAIDVRTYKGEVVLKGVVDTQQDVLHAAEIVTRVEGVVSLFNDLDVK